VLRAVLFDLDGTLLDLDMETFLPVYLSALAPRFASFLPPERFVRELLRSTGAMVANRDPERTNRQVFCEEFFGRLGLPQERLMPIFEDFYFRDFPRLGTHARAVPGARRLVQAAQDRGLRTAVATNPVFPLQAVHERLRWAGIDDLPFDFVASYEDMHFCKPHPEYFREVAERVGCRPEECLMAGDDPEMDLVGARTAGMQTFHVLSGARDGSGVAHQHPRGTVEDLLHLISVISGGSGAGRSSPGAGRTP